MLAFPADLHVALAPDDDGDGEGVLERLVPPVGVIVYAALLEVDAPCGKAGPGLLAGRSAT